MLLKELLNKNVKIFIAEPEFGFSSIIRECCIVICMPFLQRTSFAIECVQVDKAASLLAEQMNNYIGCNL